MGSCYSKRKAAQSNHQNTILGFHYLQIARYPQATPLLLRVAQRNNNAKNPVREKSIQVNHSTLEARDNEHTIYRRLIWAQTQIPFQNSYLIVTHQC